MFVPPPEALDLAARDLADRIVAALTTLVDAVTDAAMTGNIPGLPIQSANLLFIRFSVLILHLVRVSNCGSRRSPTRAPTEAQDAKPEPQPSPVVGTPAAAAGRTNLSLPRTPGWLLAAMPALEPELVTELRTLLADPAFAALLRAAPALRRRFRPVLRSLDLDDVLRPAPQPPPNQSPPRQPGPTPPDRVEPLQAANPAPQPPQNQHQAQAPNHAQFIPVA